MSDVEYYTRLAADMSEMRQILKRQMTEAKRKGEDKRAVYFENTVSFLGKMIDAANEEIQTNA